MSGFLSFSYKQRYSTPYAKQVVFGSTGQEGGERLVENTEDFSLSDN